MNQFKQNCGSFYLTKNLNIGDGFFFPWKKVKAEQDTNEGKTMVYRRSDKMFRCSLLFSHPKNLSRYLFKECIILSSM